MNLLFPAAAGLGLLLLAGSSKATPASSSAAKPQPFPKPIGGGAGAGNAASVTDFQTRISEAFSRNDYAAVLAIANEMQAAGLTEAAASVRAVVLQLQQLGAGGGSKSPGQPTVSPSAALPNPPLVVVPPFVVPSSVPLPAGVSISSTEAQRLQVAQAMAVDLRNTSRYKENQVLVKRFQDQEGLVTDGKYGPKSALALAALGVIPPRPRYWAKKTVQADKKEYAGEMLSRAATDPARAADWTAASKVQNDPLG